MAALEKLTIALTPKLADFVRGTVQAGQYATESEAVEDALREWQQRQDFPGYNLEELRVLANEGLASGPGKYESLSDLIGEARRRFANQSKA